MKNDQGLLKISEAEKLLNVRPNTLRKWDKRASQKPFVLVKEKIDVIVKKDIMKLVNSRDRS